jgi:hypothetical protein
VGKKTKPQPELCEPAGLAQYRTAPQNINPQTQAVRTASRAKALHLAGWSFRSQAARKGQCQRDQVMQLEQFIRASALSSAKSRNRQKKVSSGLHHFIENQKPLTSILND